MPGTASSREGGRADGTALKGSQRRFFGTCGRSIQHAALSGSFAHDHPTELLRKERSAIPQAWPTVRAPHDGRARMIAEVDEALCRALARVLPKGTVVRLDPPKPTWQTEKPSQAIDLFLFNLGGDERGAESGIE